MKVVCFHLNQVGDLAFSLPALKCVRDSFPGVHVTSVVRPSAAEVMVSTGLADEVLARASGVNGRKLRLARTLACGRFDLALVFSQSAECAALAYASRAAERIGFINTSLGVLLTRRVDFHHPPSTRNNLRLVSEAGCEITRTDYVGLLKPSADQIERARNLLRKHGVAPDDPIVAFAPGTSGRRGVKEWTDEGFAAVGRYLAGRGVRPVVLGTESAVGITDGCADVLDLSGKTNLGEVVAILDRCRSLVAVDSGILHLGAATGTKVVGLYGPSNPSITGPQGEGHAVLRSDAECSPCFLTECKKARQCMTDIHPEAVVTALEQILD